MIKTCFIYCSNEPGEAAWLRTVARNRNWHVRTCLVTDPRAKKPKRPLHFTIPQMMREAEADVLLVPTLLQLGITTDDVVKLAASLAASALNLVVLDPPIDGTTNEGVSWMNAMVVLNEHQRRLRIHKALLGQQQAKQAGVKFGRPRVPEATLHDVRTALKRGEGIRPTAVRLGVSPARVQAEKNKMEAHSHSS